MRDEVIRLFFTSLDAVCAENFSFDLSDIPVGKPVVLLGSGKAVCPMAQRVAAKVVSIQEWMIFDFIIR